MIIGDTHSTKQRQFDNWVSSVINVLHAVKNQQNLSWDEKLKALESVNKTFPDAKRLVIYFMNTGVKK